MVKQTAMLSVNKSLSILFFYCLLFFLRQKPELLFHYYNQKMLPDYTKSKSSTYICLISKGGIITTADSSKMSFQQQSNDIKGQQTEHLHTNGRYP